MSPVHSPARPDGNKRIQEANGWVTMEKINTPLDWSQVECLIGGLVFLLRFCTEFPIDKSEMTGFVKILIDSHFYCSTLLTYGNLTKESQLNLSLYFNPFETSFQVLYRIQYRKRPKNINRLKTCISRNVLDCYTVHVLQCWCIVENDLYFLGIHFIGIIVFSPRSCWVTEGCFLSMTMLFSFYLSMAGGADRT